MAVTNTMAVTDSTPCGDSMVQGGESEVSSTLTTEDGSESETNAEAEDENERRVKRNLLDSRDKHRNNEPALCRRVVPRKNKPNPTVEEQWKEEARGKMNEGRNRQEAMFVFTSCSAPRPETVWQRRLSSFFSATKVLEHHPFQWLLTTGKMAVTIDPNLMRDVMWKIPKIGNLAPHLKAALESAHEVMQTEWEETCKQIKEKQKHKWISQDGETEVISLPPCPKLEVLLSQCAFARNVMHKLWHSWPHSEEHDVRDMIIDWMSTELMEIKSEKEFMDVVQKKVDQGLYQKVLASGQAVIPDHLQHVQQNQPHASLAQRTPTARRRPSAMRRPVSGARRRPVSDPEVHNDEGKPEDHNEEGTLEDPIEEATDTNATRQSPRTSALGKRKRTVSTTARTKKLAKQQKLPAARTQKATRQHNLLASCGTEQEEALNESHSKDVGNHNQNEKVRKAEEQRKSKGRPISICHDALPVQTPRKSVATPAHNPSDFDSVVELLLKIYELECHESDSVQSFHAAVHGLNSTSLAEIWKKHHLVSGSEVNLMPPPQRTSKHNLIEFDKAGDDFTGMARDCLQILQIFLTSCDFRGIAPVRWHWLYILMDKINQLSAPCRKTQHFAAIVCLILSAASTDVSCIEATANLHKAGLLDINKLAVAEEEEIQTCIKNCGIHRDRAGYLKNMAIQIKEQHEGEVPDDLEALTSLPGVGRKTAILTQNESFGFFAGIGCDKHVLECCKAFGFLEGAASGVQLTPDHAECMLRQWVGQSHYPGTNKLFGGFAQMFTQNLRGGMRTEERALAQKVVKAIGDHLHKPYHIEMLWFMIGRVRNHYAGV